MSTQTLTIILATLIALSGAYALVDRRASAETVPLLNATLLVLVGAGVGFVSTLIGAGGGVLLVPILLYLGVPTLLAVGG